MEEKVFFDGEFGKICGILNIINKDNEIVIMAHGLRGHKNTSAKFLAKELETIGINSLRIDLDNVGESNLDLKTQISIPNYVKQIKSSIKFVKEKGFKEISLTGSSFGGICVLTTALTEKYIKKILLRAPVLDWQKVLLNKLGQEKLDKCEKEKLIPHTNGEGETIKYTFDCYTTAKDYSMYDRAKEIKQSIKIIQGDKDEEIDYKIAQEIVKLFPNAELKIIKGATHNLSVNGDFSLELKETREFFSKP